MKIAVVDDEENVRLALKTALRKEKYTVYEYSNGKEAFDALCNNEIPDLYVLDIMMPVMDGILFLRKYKELYPSIPAMFLTSRDEEFDKVLGLELGADDYLCKPFSMKELIARIKVILRRYEKNIPQEKTLESKNILLNMNSYTAAIDGKELILTVTEFRLLKAFIEHKNEALTRDILIENAYPDDTYLNDRAIDCHIKRLRKKIGSERIETVYGLGYRFKE